MHMVLVTPTARSLDNQDIDNWTPMHATADPPNRNESGIKKMVQCITLHHFLSSIVCVCSLNLRSISKGKLAMFITKFGL